ncbi:MAG: hypothetical protein B7X61_07000 [Gallionellales bacterium 39-52-133]|nr:MAG: hypothetical protein B7X61_07000 [Gallionellales bacterium 39-52-133]
MYYISEPESGRNFAFGPSSGIIKFQAKSAAVFIINPDRSFELPLPAGAQISARISKIPSRRNLRSCKMKWPVAVL